VGILLKKVGKSALLNSFIAFTSLCPTFPCYARNREKYGKWGSITLYGKVEGSCFLFQGKIKGEGCFLGAEKYLSETPI